MAFPHVSLKHGDAASELRNAIQRACQKQWQERPDKVVTMRPGSINDEGRWQRVKLAVLTADTGPSLPALSSSLSSFAEAFPNHVIIVTSAARKLQMSKRASDNDDDSVMDPKLGLLHRYQVRPGMLLTSSNGHTLITPSRQFFSTGLLIALLVMVLLLIPAVYFATGLLAGIETPDRLGETNRSGMDKKSQ